MTAVISRIEASCCSSKWSAALFQTSSETASVWSASRVEASASASAARSASV
ncbi:hypothetical protein ACIBG4_10060 [Nonomuraea sp. NPDC050383]|uniref:hypothetical protein n=1 Tax=Nonomuraea sp. NPDC050383 TaxID=3364362 RepID=UPI0037A161FA